MPEENDGESRALDAAARRRDSRQDGGATRGPRLARLSVLHNGRERLRIERRSSDQRSIYFLL
jgi:hypothetical protein